MNISKKNKSLKRNGFFELFFEFLKILLLKFLKNTYVKEQPLVNIYAKYQMWDQRRRL